MKEFIEKLIGRLEEYPHGKYEDEYGKGFSAGINASIEEVNELTEEYSANTPQNSADGWIPCSERLPEEENYYLVTKEDDIAYSIDIALWNPHYHWSNNGFHKADKVIAWMPLPAPYKEGVTENE